ncbi:MAG: hypothetical protein AAF674_04840 [Pseudomonadota bacterium]
MLRRAIHQSLKYILWHWLMECSAHRGIVLRFWEQDKLWISKVHDAIDLIERLDPRTFRLMRRLLEGGIAVDLPQTRSLGWYDDDRKACGLARDYVPKAPVEDIALTIVHETCHARLMHCGIGYTEAERYRVEQVCRRREIAFARLLAKDTADAETLVQDALDRLERMSPEDHTDAAWANRRWRDQLMRLRHQNEMGGPKCLRRLVVRRARNQRSAHRWREPD